MIVNLNYGSLDIKQYNWYKAFDVTLYWVCGHGKAEKEMEIACGP
jgi:hypothetical protein